MFALKHIWRRPKGLLGRGLDAPPSIPLNVGIVQGHLLCASEEFPLCGDHPITEVLHGDLGHFTADSDLFGGKDVYLESLENLCDNKNVQVEIVSGQNKFKTYAKHPVSFSFMFSFLLLIFQYIYRICSLFPWTVY